MREVYAITTGDYDSVVLFVCETLEQAQVVADRVHDDGNGGGDPYEVRPLPFYEAGDTVVAEERLALLQFFDRETAELTKPLCERLHATFVHEAGEAFGASVRVAAVPFLGYVEVEGVDHATVRATFAAELAAARAKVPAQPGD